MEKESIQIEFETITPIWTGDAFGKNQELKPSSIMGSLRFWFETYCHFSKIEVIDNENLEYKKYEKLFEQEIKNSKNITLDKCEEELIKALPLTLSSKIFGCTGWKSRIEIKDIKEKSSQAYPYPSKSISLKNKRKSTWYFPKGFLGKFTITFQASKNLQENVLFPLLHFIEKYGFLGAKNNTGYGRVIMLESKFISKYRFNLEFLGEKKNIDENIFSLESDKDTLKLNYNKIEVLNFKDKDKNLTNLIKELIKKKSGYRNKHRQSEDKKQEERHVVFGTIRKAKWEQIKIPQATKIIPLISKNEDSTYKGQFLSIVGIQNFGAENERKF